MSTHGTMQRAWPLTRWAGAASLALCSLVAYIASAPRTLWAVLVTSPVRYVVLNGPRARLTLGVATVDVGFWQGAAEHDICAAMTGTPSVAWVSGQGRQHCLEMVEKYVRGVEVCVVSLVVLYAACFAVRLCLWVCAHRVVLGRFPGALRGHAGDAYHYALPTTPTPRMMLRSAHHHQHRRQHHHAKHTP